MSGEARGTKVSDARHDIACREGQARIKRRGGEGKGAHAFEINRKKQVLWKNNDYSIAELVSMVRFLDE